MSSVAFPAFLLGHDPRRRIFGISYGSDLAAKHAIDFGVIVNSPWYRRIFSGMRIARTADSNFYTTARGFRMATSVNAALTGMGGDCMILDDPQKPEDAQSEALRTQTNQWYTGTLISRLDNKQTGIIILVTQRIHLNDLTGYLLETSDDWSVLSLAAIAEADENIEIGEGLFHHRRAGEALHPEHESLASLEKLRREMGPDAFLAQCQQAPVPAGGAMIKRPWIVRYDVPPDRKTGCKIIQSWDTAAKNGAQNDWSVCTTWLLQDESFYLLDLVRDRYEYPQLRDIVLELANRYEPDDILIEDASTGVALSQELGKLGHHRVTLVPVHRDKIGRLYTQQAKFSAGHVRFPRR
jgi:hypothetical protein